MTRYYYTCPIKALYMMKEFGVELYIEGKQLSSCNLSTGEVDKNEKIIQIDFEEEYLDQILGSFGEIRNLESKIYVKVGSGSIFEPKPYDLRIDNSGDACEFQDCHEWIAYNEFRSNNPKNHNPKIIMREGKQFFMPEVEND